MLTDCNYLPYDTTHSFTRIVLDYLAADEKLLPFYRHPVSVEGLQAAITARKGFATNRGLLVDELRKQYAGITLTSLQEQHLQHLLLDSTFTITTAHQPNIFTGHLYFIYKILHTIRLCKTLEAAVPGNNYVPVFYMGSEDADLEELGHINIDGEKLEWQTDQSGAVGRMHTKGLDLLIKRLSGEFGHLPYGQEMIALCEQAYLHHANIQQATLYLVNELFKHYGLLVLIPDNAALKRAFEPVIIKEIEEQFSHRLVADTIERIGEHYKVQAGGRELNLFYLADDGRRERIELTGGEYIVGALGLRFSKDSLLEELRNFPERFSANVILRGVFQETILPNIAFIGGGGELAYWLELGKVFDAVGVPFPVLILRNSFLLIEPADTRLMKQLSLTDAQLFETGLQLQQLLTSRSSPNRLTMPEEQQEVNEIYAKMQYLAAAVDPTLQAHVAALHTRALQDINGLEKKMMRAEKRKYGDLHRQLQTLKGHLFPKGQLQERVDNIMPWYAKYGPGLIDRLYDHSLALEAEFGIISISRPD